MDYGYFIRIKAKKFFFSRPVKSDHFRSLGFFVDENILTIKFWTGSKEVMEEDFKAIILISFSTPCFFVLPSFSRLRPHVRLCAGKLTKK